MSVLREAAAAEFPASGWHPDGNAGWPGCCGDECVSVKQKLLGGCLDEVMPMCAAGAGEGTGEEAELHLGQAGGCWVLG